MKKILISDETGCVLWLENGVEMFAPIGTNGVVNFDEAGEADLELVGNEAISGNKSNRTISDVWAEARELLQ